MNGWDVVITIINQFPPVAMTLLLIIAIAAGITGLVGFSRHGMDFIKHGFQQNVLGELLDKLATKEDIKASIDGLRSEVRSDINRLEARIDNMETRFEKVETRFEKVETRFEKVEARMGNMEAELATIKVNHFGHLKNFLTELTSILLDKQLITHENKARLDNHLRGM